MQKHLILLATLLSVLSCNKEKEKIVYVDVIKEVEVIKEVSTQQEMATSTETLSTSSTSSSSTSTSTSQDIMLTGSLAIDGSSAGLGLTSFGLAATSASHSIYCTTFEDSPIACVADVVNGEFSKSCENYAGKTFGCFLRKDGTTLTTIEFGGDTSLVTGSGTLKSSVVFDSKTGLARAKIDEEASTELASDAIAQAMKAQGVTKTKLPDMSGTWNIDCVNDPEAGMYCNLEDDPNYSTAVDTSGKYCFLSASVSMMGKDMYVECSSGGVDVPAGFCYDEYAYWDQNLQKTVPGYHDCSSDYAYCSDPAMAMMPECIEKQGNSQPAEIPTSMYLSQYEDPVTGNVKIGLWESKDRRDACISTNGSENNPSFGLKLADGSNFSLFEFNLSTKSAMDASIDLAIDNMYNSSNPDHKYIAQKIISMGATREAWRVDQCKNSPYKDASNTPIDTLEDDPNNQGQKIQSATCKFRLEEFETYTWEDWSTGSPISRTESYTRWWWDVHEFNSNISGNWSTSDNPFGVIKETVLCTFDASDGSGKPFCPSYASAAGTYNQYYKTDANGKKSRLMLVCRVEQDSWDWLQQSAAPSDVMSDAINALKDANGCSPLYSGSNVLAGLPEVQIESVRRVALELSLSKNYRFDTANLCHGVETAASWTFNRCNNMSYGDNGYQLCWENYNFQSKLGMSQDYTAGSYYNGCSNPAYSDQASCTNPANDSQSTWYLSGFSCSNSMYYDKFGCENSGATWQAQYQCSDGFSSNETDCLASTTPNQWNSSGYCSDSSKLNAIDCHASKVTAVWNGSSCSNGYSTDQTSCEASLAPVNTWTTNSGSSWISTWDSYFYEICAGFSDATNVASAYDDWMNAGKPESGYLVEDLVDSCRTYLNSGTSAQKLAKQKNVAKQAAMRMEWMPTKAIACGAPTTSIKDTLMNGLDQSCMADASLNMFCDYSGNCMSSLRCNGSGEGGKCYKDGSFVGNIPGRMGFMNLKLRSGGAFELSETKEDRWKQWNITDNKEEICDATRTMVLNSKKVGNDEFNSVFKTTEKMECVSKEMGTCSDTTYTSKAECESNSGNWTEISNTANNSTSQQGSNSASATNFDRAGMGDLLKKLTFKRCADTSCSEY
ncbi:MAG: hypothetical protein R3B45_14410 [Bdellovibrionota bacterium]